MASVATCCACEAASCCVGVGCRCCCMCLPFPKSTLTRFVYLSTFLIISLVAFLLSRWGSTLLDWFPPLKHTPSDVFGVSAVYRITAALATYHLLLVGMTMGVKSGREARAVVHDGIWFLKIGGLLGLIVGAFYLPNAGLVWIGWIALVGAGVFILIQLVLLVNFAHSWNESWMAKWAAANEGDDKWYYLLLAVTLACGMFSLILSIVLLALYSSCATNVVLVVINAIAGIAVSILSISPAVQSSNARSGLLQSSVVFAYSTYLVFSAVLSFPPESSCSVHALEGDDSSALNTSFIIGATFTFLSVIYSTVRTSSQSDEIIGGVDKTLIARDDEADNDFYDERNAVKYNYSFFHFILATATLYVAMLVSNWSILHEDNSNHIALNTGTAAVWVKAVSSWIALSLYAWSLAAPILMPGRDFS